LLPAFLLWVAGELYFRIRHREGLGLGDVKLIAMVGSFMGLPGALWTLILGGVSGSILGALYIKATGKEFGTYELPFGTFLGVAALVLAVWHVEILGL
jgi:leader peptidase (prepilin peptidase)/N-methyltransferase